MMMQRRRRTCWRTRAVRERTVAVGDAAAGRVHRAFEDAGDGRGAERGGDKNGGEREGELVILRQRCRKRLHVAGGALRGGGGQQDVTQQPAGTNKEGGSRMDVRGGCVTKGNARRRMRYNRRRDNQPENSGKREVMRQRTRGGGALIIIGCGGGRVKRTRGGGIDTTTSWQTRDNHGDGEGEGDDDGDGKCHAATITGLGERQPRSSRLKLWMRKRR